VFFAAGGRALVPLIIVVVVVAEVLESNLMPQPAPAE
jgi:hypothetical protein